MQRGWWVAVVVLGTAVGCAELEEDEPALVPVAALPLSKNSGGEGVEGRNGGMEVAADGIGKTATYSTNAFGVGPSHAFFARLGTNARTCNSCHRQDQGWTVAASKVRDLAPDDPLFAPVDGADCPPSEDDEPADASRSTLLRARGVIRIQLPLADESDFTLASATNPLGCAVAPASPAADGALMLFRRPLPTANLEFATAVMWDGRETRESLTQAAGLANRRPLIVDLAYQDEDAVAIHQQGANSILGTPASADLVSFEAQLFAGQLTVGSVRLDRAHGGPRYLAEVVAPAFFVGENDPAGKGFTSTVFTLYKAWEPGANGAARRHVTEAEKAIGRGEQIFNTRTFTISNVGGLNSAKGDPVANPQDPLFDKPIAGTCSTCHNAFDTGGHSTALFLDIGLTRASRTDGSGLAAAGALELGDLPVYTLRSASGTTVDVTDPGRALVTGRFVDAGKTKVPVLRALSARAPYFHNGSAADLESVVRFYDGRFGIGLTEQEAADLVAFLRAL